MLAGEPDHGLIQSLRRLTELLLLRLRPAGFLPSCARTDGRLHGRSNAGAERRRRERAGARKRNIHCVLVCLSVTRAAGVTCETSCVCVWRSVVVVVQRFGFCSQ